MSAFLKTQWFTSTACESTLADTPHKRMPHCLFFIKAFSNNRFWFPISCCSICRGVSRASHASGNGWYKSWICGDKIKARRRHPHLWTHWFPTAVVESFLSLRKFSLSLSLCLSHFTPHFQPPPFLWDRNLFNLVQFFWMELIGLISKGAYRKQALSSQFEMYYSSETLYFVFGTCQWVCRSNSSDTLNM